MRIARGNLTTNINESETEFPIFVKIRSTENFKISCAWNMGPNLILIITFSSLNLRFFSVTYHRNLNFENYSPFHFKRNKMF